MTLRYNPKSASYLSFAAAKRAFLDGSDTPCAFLERCIEQIECRETEIRAFVRLDIEGARAQADASADR
jgi:Asp-tRNA(Asn)/Glu-tRNA(Gln) amidotransferase A subunit family amidase